MPGPVPIARGQAGQSPVNTVIPRFYLMVVDENGKPLDGKYALYQNQKLAVESWLTNGQAVIYNLDKTQPFTIDVPGRVCAIQEGAVLQIDDNTQYAGQFFDWKQADDAAQADAFWREYDAERAAGRWGPSTFWQHEHLVRRQFRVRQKYLDNFPSLVVTIQAVPLQVRVGPLVRYTDHKQAVIWLELETPGLVRVAYGKFDDGGAKVERYASTVRAGGRHFAAVVLDQLDEDTLYAYHVELAPMPAVMKIPVTQQDFEREKSFATILPQAVRDATDAQLAARSFASPPNPWLTFHTLKRQYPERFNFCHGSCRKYAGDTDPRGGMPGKDTMDAVGRDWLAKHKRDEWPAFLFLGGDQIYADDIGKNTGLAMRWQRYSSQLVGPKDDGVVGGAWAGRFADRFIGFSPKAVDDNVRALSQKLIALHKQYEAWQKRVPVEFGRDEGIALLNAMRETQRQIDDWGVVSEDAGYVMRESKTRPMRFKWRVTNNHLWAIPTDVLDVPIISTSEVLKRRPDKNDPPHARHPAAGEEAAMHAADFAEYSYLYEKSFTTEWSARVLANVPTFMMCDDHEITDDWNFDRTWTQIIHSDKDSFHYWPKTIADGLASYWVYQGWCNLRPDTWASDPRTKILLDAQKTGKDALPELRKIMLERVVNNAGHPEWMGEDLPFHYALPMEQPTFVVTDSRTRRNLGATHEQSQTIDDKQLKWLRDKLENAQGQLAFVLFTTPYFLPHAVSFAMRHPLFTDSLQNLNPEHVFWDLMQDDRFEEAMMRDADMEHMVIDRTWDDFRAIVKHLEHDDVVTQLKAIVMLSGDVHFSYGMLGRSKKDEEQHEMDPRMRSYPEMLQLVSSSFRNTPGEKRSKRLKWFSENIFSKIHTVRDMWLMPQFFARGAPHDREYPNFLTENSAAFVEAEMDPTFGGDGVVVRQFHLADGYDDRPVLVYRSNEPQG